MCTSRVRGWHWGSTFLAHGRQFVGVGWICIVFRQPSSFLDLLHAHNAAQLRAAKFSKAYNYSYPPTPIIWITNVHETEDKCDKYETAFLGSECLLFWKHEILKQRRQPVTIKKANVFYKDVHAKMDCNGKAILTALEWKIPVASQNGRNEWMVPAGDRV